MPAYEILKSEKNRDVLLVEGFLFWFDRATPKGRKYWKCIYCYRGYDGEVKNKCLSRVITSPNDPVAVICKVHNHCRDTVLVEVQHMKAFGSIRRLASSLRTPSRKASNSPDSSSTSSSIENAPMPSTSESLELQPSPTKRPYTSKALPSSPAPKKPKKALADVLETLYNRLQKPSTSPPPKPKNSSFLVEKHEFIESEDDNPKKEETPLHSKLSSQVPQTTSLPSLPPTSTSIPSPMTQIFPKPHLQPPAHPQAIDLSVTGQPGFANPHIPSLRLPPASWLALANLANLYAANVAAAAAAASSRK